jgi:hypothetical protein
MILMMGPIGFVIWVAERVLEAAEAEQDDERTIMAELAQLNDRYDQGVIDDDTFQAHEDELMERLEAARTRRRK